MFHKVKCAISRSTRELFESALSVFSKKNYEKAIEEFQKITQKSLLILKNYYLGLSYVQLGLFEKGLEHYRKIHEIPRSIQGVEYDRIIYGLYINMGSVLQALAKKNGRKYFEEAAICYNYAIEIRNDDERLWNNLGNVQLEMGKYSAAIESFNKALEINDEFPEAYYCLSLVYEYKKEYNKAIDYLKTELKWKAKNRVVLNRLAGLLFATGKFQEAKGYAEQVNIAYPQDKNGLKNLALINYNLSIFDEAYANYQQLIKLYPDFDPRETATIFEDLVNRFKKK